MLEFLGILYILDFFTGSDCRKDKPVEKSKLTKAISKREKVIFVFLIFLPLGIICFILYKLFRNIFVSYKEKRKEKKIKKESFPFLEDKKPG